MAAELSPELTAEVTAGNEGLVLKFGVYERKVQPGRHRVCGYDSVFTLFHIAFRWACFWTLSEPRTHFCINTDFRK